jgi:tRNA A37 threonylcarbamoyladenosine dehydratase
MIAARERTLESGKAEKASVETRMYSQLFGLSNAREYLLERIHARQATVAVIGLGYVGLPLAMAYAEAGFDTIGIDIDVKRVANLNMGHSHVSDVPAERLALFLNAGKGRALPEAIAPAPVR